MSRFMAQDNYWAVGETRKRTFIRFFSWNKKEYKSHAASWGGGSRAGAQVCNPVCVCVRARVTPDEVSVHVNAPSLRELQRLLVPELMKAHGLQHTET